MEQGVRMFTWGKPVLLRLLLDCRVSDQPGGHLIPLETSVAHECYRMYAGVIVMGLPGSSVVDAEKRIIEVADAAHCEVFRKCVDVGLRFRAAARAGRNLLEELTLQCRVGDFETKVVAGDLMLSRWIPDGWSMEDVASASCGLASDVPQVFVELLGSFRRQRAHARVRLRRVAGYKQACRAAHTNLNLQRIGRTYIDSILAHASRADRYFLSKANGSLDSKSQREFV
jgi:hypothetical protein